MQQEQQQHSVFQVIVCVSDDGTIDVDFADSYLHTVSSSGEVEYLSGHDPDPPHATILDAVLFEGETDTPSWLALERLAARVKAGAS